MLQRAMIFSRTTPFKRFFYSLFFFSVSCFANYSPFGGTDLVSGKSLSVDFAKAEKGTVLVFLSTRCPCSQSHEPVLKDLAKRFKDFSFIGVHSNKDEEAQYVKAHFHQVGLPFPVLDDSSQKTADTFGAFKTPHAFVIDREGKLVFSGGIDDSHTAQGANDHFLFTVLEAMNSGQPVPFAEKRALGCVIKR